MTTNDPIAEFQRLYKRIIEQNVSMHDAVALATATPDGAPSVRMVLLKAVDERGFVFYTNFESRKGREMESNPRASLCFYWKELAEQVRVEGSVKPVSDAEADAYFATRDRDSQIGAWASRQSEPMRSPNEIMQAFMDMRRRFGSDVVPRPPHWSGFRLEPVTIEFWSNRMHRLHERRLYTRVGDSWTMEWLFP